MATDNSVERRMYERRIAARRGAGLEPTLEEIFAEEGGENGSENPEIQERRLGQSERRSAIRRQVDQELHDFIIEETAD